MITYEIKSLKENDTKCLSHHLLSRFHWMDNREKLQHMAELCRSEIMRSVMSTIK